MRSIQKPEISIASIIHDCVSNMRSGEEKYTNAIDYIVRQSGILDERINRLEAGMIETHDIVTRELTKDDMVSLYDNKFSKKTQPGRPYYDKLILLADHGTCPLCGISHVATLDHYMAKSIYPVFAVSPINLVPACRDCNTIRGTKVFRTSTDMTLHPYYDEVQSFDWLTAKVVEGRVFSVEYSVSDQIEDEILKARLNLHLDVFHLRTRYAIKAVEEIAGIKRVYQKLYRIGGREALVHVLRLYYDSYYENERNSWKTALYKALIESDQWIAS